MNLNLCDVGLHRCLPVSLRIQTPLLTDSYNGIEKVVLNQFANVNPVINNGIIV